MRSTKTAIRIASFILLLASVVAYADNREATISPQFSMSGARSMSFGGISPVLLGDINGALINPASLGDVEFPQGMFTHQQILGEFNYQTIGVAVPYNGVTYGLTFGSDMLSGIPETVYQGGVVNSIGTYSSGFQVLNFSAATSTTFDFFYVDKLSYGISVKALQQVIAADSRTAYGIDAGAIGTFYFPGDYGIDRAHVGVSAINLLSTPLPEWKGSGQNPVARQLFLGGRLDMWEDRLFLYLNLYGARNLIDEFSAGGEYYLSPNLIVRGSYSSDTRTTPLTRYNFGTGLFFPKVAGIGYDEYSMRFDYNYTMYPYPFEGDSINTISVSFLGEARNTTPKMVEPSAELLTQKTTTVVRGTAERGADVVIYNNDIESRHAVADRYGKWRYENFPLVQGTNRIFVRARRRNLDQSNKSPVVYVISDSKAPTFNLKIQLSPDKNRFTFLVETSEEASKVELASTGNEHAQFNKLDAIRYELNRDMPAVYRDQSYITEKLTTFSVTVADMAGNIAKPLLSQYFLAFSNPKDKSVVYGKKISVNGQGCSAIQLLKINGEKVSMDKSYAFSNPVALKPGKNMIKVEVAGANGQVYTYYARVLSLMRFPDLDRTFEGRRDIEFLATLGYIGPRPDGNFYPNVPMTRIDITRMLVKLKDLTVKAPEYDPFLDVTAKDPDAGIIQAAVDNGLMFAYPDGTFKPNAPLSVSDAFKILTNNSIIDSDETVVDTTPITRAKFALMLKQIKNYQKRVEYLLDFEQGYPKN